MNKKEIEASQLQILELTSNFDEVAPVPLDGILRKITQYSHAEIQDGLGEFGIKLLRFAQSIDVDDPHPDLFTIYDGQFVGDFSRIACDVLLVINYIRDKNVSSDVVDGLRRLVTRHPAYSVLSQNIDSPLSNLRHVRFLDSSEKRQECRKQKSDQVVGLGVLYKKGKSYWNAHGQGFESYHRHVNRYQKERSEAVERLKHFSQFGLKSMSQEIEHYIERLDEKARAEQYLGFNKISLTTASIILAKMNGFEFDVDYQPYSYSRTHAAMCYTQASQHDWFDLDPNEQGCSSKIEIRPRTYPYAEVKDECSPDVRELVDSLESCPATNNKPLFDHYRVLITGVDFPNSSQWKPSYALDGQPLYFDSVSEGQRSLDMHLMRSDVLTSILVGERDGEHFFICYWV